MYGGLYIVKETHWFVLKSKKRQATLARSPPHVWDHMDRGDVAICKGFCVVGWSSFINVGCFLNTFLCDFLDKFWFVIILDLSSIDDGFYYLLSTPWDSLSNSSSQSSWRPSWHSDQYVPFLFLLHKNKMKKQLERIIKKQSHQRKVVKKLRSMYINEKDPCKATQILNKRDKETSKLISLSDKLIAHCYSNILSSTHQSHAKATVHTLKHQDRKSDHPFLQNLFPDVSTAIHLAWHATI